jgi:aspartate ammonia-lyase
VRAERDALGEKTVPDDAYYGIHTQRCRESLNFSSLRLQPELIKSMAHIKLACAKANTGLGLLDSKKSAAIIKACEEIIAGKHSDQFVIDVFQSGSGTNTHMNVNEVIANRASEILGRKKGSKFVHPNDDVNMGQSTNDVFPSAIKVAVYPMLLGLVHKLKSFEAGLRKKAVQFEAVIKSARTHLQDAVPITLGQEFSAYAAAVKKDILRLDGCIYFLTVLAIGGNAVGTGINTHKDFRRLAIESLNDSVKLKFRQADDGVEAVQFLTDIADLSANLKLLSIDLSKIANDLRLLGSGPNTGLNEINITAVAPGSSIMPGKVNPTLLEAINMACYQVQGNDLTIANCCSAGQLELNTHMPVVAYNIIQSLEIMANSVNAFENVVNGITVNEDVCKKYSETSAGLATILNPYIGYDKAAEVVKESLKTGKSVKEIILKKKLLHKKELKNSKFRWI